MKSDSPLPAIPPYRLRTILATGLGVGYAPLIPGTFGSIPGVLLAWGLWAAWGPAAVVVAVVVVTAVGVWAAEGAARRFGDPDPHPVVVDEIAGQLVTLLFVAPGWRTYVLGFFLFRVLDIIKPFPANAAERLPGGSGIMADDLVAGIYGNVLLQAATYWFPRLMGTA